MVVSSILLLTLYISSIGSAASNHRSYLRALCITGMILALAITGYLLPWGQHGFWSAKIRTHIMSLKPVIGSGLEGLILRRTELGHYTLTHFFALHAGWLPILFWLGLMWAITLCVARILFVNNHRQLRRPVKQWLEPRLVRSV